MSLRCFYRLKRKSIVLCSFFFVLDVKNIRIIKVNENKNMQMTLSKSKNRFPFLRDNINERTVLCHINNNLKLKIKNKFQERNDRKWKQNFCKYWQNIGCYDTIFIIIFWEICAESGALFCTGRSKGICFKILFKLADECILLLKNIAL